MPNTEEGRKMEINVTDYSDWVVSLCKTLYLKHHNSSMGTTMEIQDFIGTAWIGVLLARKTHNPDLGGFWNYAQKNIKWEIYKEMRRNAPVLPRRTWHTGYPFQDDCDPGR